MRQRDLQELEDGQHAAAADHRGRPPAQQGAGPSELKDEIAPGYAGAGQQAHGREGVDGGAAAWERSDHGGLGQQSFQPVKRSPVACHSGATKRSAPATNAPGQAIGGLKMPAGEPVKIS